MTQLVSSFRRPLHKNISQSRSIISPLNLFIMTFQLQPLTRRDVPRCVTIYFAAFQNPHSLGCWPRTANVRKWWENMICDELDEVGSHWLKAVSTSTGDIAGFVKWQEPKHDTEPSTDLPVWPGDADEALCNETFGTWARQHRNLMGRRGHWCRSTRVRSNACDLLMPSQT